MLARKKPSVLALIMDVRPYSDKRGVCSLLTLKYVSIYSIAKAASHRHISKIAALYVCVQVKTTSHHLDWVTASRTDRHRKIYTQKWYTL